MSRTKGASYRSRSGAAKRKVPLALLYDRCGGICYLCKRRIPFEEASRDHYLPAALGGPYEWHNFRLACISCNAKRTKGLERIARIEWRICPNCKAKVAGGAVLRCYGNPEPIRAKDLERLVPQVKAYRNAKRDHKCKLSKRVRYRIGRNGTGNYDVTTDLIELGQRVVDHLKKENQPTKEALHLACDRKRRADQGGRSRNRYAVERKEMTEASARKCIKNYCTAAPELGDLLGHNGQAHAWINALCSNGYHRVTTVQQLRDMADQDLLDIRLIGRRAVIEIRRRIAEKDAQDSGIGTHMKAVTMLGREQIIRLRDEINAWLDQNQ